MGKSLLHQVPSQGLPSACMASIKGDSNTSEAAIPDSNIWIADELGVATIAKNAEINLEI